MTKPATTVALLDAPELMRLAEAVIIDAGADYRYHGITDICDRDDCRYVTALGEPDCLIARILHRHGVSIAILSAWEGFSAREMAEGYLRRETPGRAMFTQRAAYLAEQMQHRQDDNMAWGDVLEDIRRVARSQGIEW